MERRSHPFSLRLSASLDTRLTRLAQESQRSKAAVLESLADEAERCRRYPGIAFRGHEPRRRAWVIGTSFDVWQILRGLEDFNGDADRMAAETDLERSGIRLAVAYGQEFPEETAAAIAADRRELRELKEQYPFIQVLELND